MKISPKILSIPPYISTSWKNIASLHLENQSDDNVLIITLHNGAQIEVPHLETSLIETIFAAHIHHLELEEKVAVNKPLSQTPFSLPAGNTGHFSLELLALDNSSIDLNGFSSLMHDASQANAPKLPEDILEKIGHIAQAMGLDDPQALPQPETDCNCMRCQIASAIQSCLRPKEDTLQEEPEEIVSDEDLKFSTWHVSQAQDKLYIVTNPLEESEQYQVHLGDPIGCTCGHEHCEHVRAVLNT